MMDVYGVGIFLGLAVMARLGALVISRRHARALLARGAVEHDAANSRLLAFSHTLFYILSIATWILKGCPISYFTTLGMVLYLCAMGVLAYVIGVLGPAWTVKLYTFPDQVFVDRFLFRRVRHPNYYLNIIPELFALGILCHSWYILAVGLAFYILVPLRRRIQAEEKILKASLQGYKAS